MEESISMWSIILPCGVALITAYCIYQQNKHYLKVKLACEMIESSKDIVRQFIPRLKSDVNYRSAVAEAHHKLASLGVDSLYIYRQLEQMGFDDCFKEMEDYVKAEKLPSYKRHDPEKNNYLEQAVSALRESQGQLIKMYASKINTQNQREKDHVSNREINELEGKLSSVSMHILAYVSHLKLLIIQEKIPFIKAINQFLTTVSNKIKGYKNKLLDWQIQSKK